MAINGCRKSPFVLVHWLICGGSYGNFYILKVNCLCQVCLHPLKLFVFQKPRVHYINTTSNYQLNFIINCCSEMLKQQINCFLKGGSDLTVRKQFTTVMIP